MNNQLKSQVLEELQKANNVLVTVSANPTVDELAASVGLTLVLNKLGKHATTVFSGVVPSTIEFLQPEKTIETTTDSLRDFIIALDKSKADKLRYKVEDNVVRIFITPYRATITEADLDFSHGDFNVDVVIGLGIARREDLDKAIVDHGRILHDAAVICLTKRENNSELGSINWQEPQASSLCEMVTALAYELKADIMDGQMATAFLTGIIAETDRFRNEHTTPLALSLSSQLMSSGANQQLIAEKLEEPASSPMPLSELPEQPQRSYNDGELSIEHHEPEFDSPEIENIHIDEHGNLNKSSNNPQEAVPKELPEVESYEEAHGSYLQAEQPKHTGDDLFNELAAQDMQSASPAQPASLPTARGKVIQPPADAQRVPKSDKPFDLQEALNENPVTHSQVLPTLPAEQVVMPTPVVEPPAAAPSPPLQAQPVAPLPVVETPVVPTPPAQSAPTQNDDSDTLADLEKAVASPHLQQATTDESIKAAQDALSAAVEGVPIAPVASPTTPDTEQTVNQLPAPLPAAEQSDSQAPPPVPPPAMMPQFYDADGSNSNPFLDPTNHQ